MACHWDRKSTPRLYSLGVVSKRSSAVLQPGSRASSGAPCATTMCLDRREIEFVLVCSELGFTQPLPSRDRHVS